MLSTPSGLDGEKPDQSICFADSRNAFFCVVVCVLVPSEAVVASKYKNKVESFSVAAIRPKDLFRRSGKR